MDIEEAFVVAGNFGRFQILLTAITYYANLLFSSQILIMVIVGATPNTNIPAEANLTTIVTEWNLYDEAWIISLLESLFLAGYMAGSLLFGQLPDLFGRKPTLVASFSAASACCFCSAFCQNWHTFAVTRFLGGVFAGAATAPAFVIMCELIGRNLWAKVGMLCQIFFSFGLMLLGLLGYLLQDWRKIMMVSSGLSAMVLPFFIFILPESPRWLYSVGKIAEAEKIMKSIARKNGNDDSAIRLVEPEVDSSKKEDFRMHSLIDLFKIKTLTLRLLVVSLIWFSCALSYYGLTLDAGSLMPNIFLATVLSGAVEIPAYIATVFLIESRWFGRNGSLVLLLLASSLTSICILFTNGNSENPIQTVLGLTSKLTIAAAFSIMFIYISEVFPTQLRTSAMTFANMTCRLGGIVASFVGLLANKAFYLPYIVLGIGTLLAGAVGLLLPETLGRPVVLMSDFDTRTSRTSNKKHEVKEDSINPDEKTPLMT